MGFSRQEYWCGLPISYSRGSTKSLTLGLNPCLLHLLNWQMGSLSPAPPGKPSWCGQFKVIIWLIVIIFSMKKSLLLLRTDHLFYLLLFSHCVWLFETPWLQHIGLPCPSPSPGVCSDSCPLSQGCHLTISFPVIHFSSCPQSFQHQDIFQRFDSLHQEVKILEFQLQHQSFQWIFRVDFL